MPDPADNVIPSVTSAWRDAGMSDRGIAGVLFNINEESRFNPALRHPDQPNWSGEAAYAHGLYQEGGAEWNRYQSFLSGRKGADWRDPDMQNQFAAWNLKTNYPNTWAKMVNAKSPEQAAAVYAGEYLKPSAPNLASRMNKIFGGIPKLSSYAEPPPEDLLGKWLNSPTGNQPAPSPAGASAPSEAPPEDLLGSWKVPAAQTAAPTSPQPPTAAVPSPAPSQPSGPETIPQALTRLTAEAYGHGQRNLSDVITGNAPDSWTDQAIRLGAGVARGVGNVGDTIAQGVVALGDNTAKALARYGAISPESAKAVEDWRASVNAGIDQDQAAFQEAAKGSALSQVGVIGGEIAGTGPILGAAGAAVRGTPVAAALASRPWLNAAVSGAATGAGTTALTSAASDAPLSEQLTQGAETGAVLGPVGHLVGRIGSALVGAGLDPESAKLAATAATKFGIPLRSDQLSGSPMVRFMGSVMQRLPFTGLGEQTAEQKIAFNRAVANEFGESADKITAPVMARAKERIGQAFEDVAQRTGAIRVDHPFAADVGNIINDARTVLGRDAAPIEDQIQRIGDRIDPATGALDAKSYQSLVAKDTPFDRAQKSTDPNVRFYAGKLRDALDDMMQRSAPPDAVADLKQARYQWAIMKAVEPLVKKAPTGDISPALLLNRARGGNLMELGQIGQRFLKEPPSSGTAERSAVLGLLGAGLTGDYAFDPEGFQKHALIAGTALAGARAGGALLRWPTLAQAIVRRGQQQRPSALGNLLPAVIPAGGALATRP